MSADAARERTWRERVGDAGFGGAREFALGSSLLLVFSFTFVLFEVTDVVGNPDTFLLIVAVSLGAATVLSRVLPVRVAVPIGILLLVVGLYSYAAALPADFVSNWDRIVDDVVSLLNGLSVLRLQKIELWALGFTPAPVFLTWYFALRRHYVAGVLAGGAALSFFVLTGDVDATVALLGVVGAVGTVGFGRLDRFGGGESIGGERSVGIDRQRRTVLVEAGAVVAVSSTISVVPGEGSQLLQPFGGPGPNTVEASLVDADERIDLQGSIELSPTVRFTVRASDAAYWRVAAYDRYTGAGWVRTGGQRDDRALPSSSGTSEEIRQRYEIESEIATMPAAWRPVAVEGEQGDEAVVTSTGGIRPRSPLSKGDSYEVRSRRPIASGFTLDRAGDDYPDRIAERYTQLPASTPDRVRQRTERITANADSPYEIARVVERWLENNREYSLEVDRPDGDVADAFLFEMDRGYCTYYATTMAAMLRSVDVPARFVVGYTPGERVDDDRWVVRGLDSHAWVEVYFPDVGWMRFDPTPAGPRAAAERERIERARENGEPNVDTDDSDEEATATVDTPESLTPTPGSETPTPTPEEATRTTTDAPAGGVDAENGTVAGTDEGFTFESPSREETALGLVLLGGVVAGLRQTGAADRAYRAVWVRWQPRESPAVDVERAFDRLEYALGRTARERRPGETARSYLDAVDAGERAHRVCDHYERTRYGGGVTEAAADEAVALVDAIVGDRL